MVVVWEQARCCTRGRLPLGLVFRQVKSGNNGADGSNSCLLCSAWLFHPFSINISTRGNADSIVALLVLLTVLFVMRKQLVLAALT